MNRLIILNSRLYIVKYKLEERHYEKQDIKEGQEKLKKNEQRNDDFHKDQYQNEAHNEQKNGDFEMNQYRDIEIIIVYHLLTLKYDFQYQNLLHDFLLLQLNSKSTWIYQQVREQKEFKNIMYFNKQCFCNHYFQIQQFNIFFNFYQKFEKYWKFNLNIKLWIQLRFYLIKQKRAIQVKCED